MGLAYVKVCRSCGCEFVTGDVRKVRCRKDCGRGTHNVARRVKAELHQLTFVGVDGEGVDRPDGEHEYVMLSVGGETLFRDGRVLDIREILSFLWECYKKHPSACFVGFFLGYDFNNWFKQLPESTARLLLTDAGVRERTSERKSRANPVPDAVVFEGWEFDVMAGRRFKLRPHVHRRSLFSDECRNRTCRVSLADSQGSVVVSESDRVESIRPFTGWADFVKGDSARDSGPAGGWLFVCDTGSFWQSSFVSVIDPLGWGGDPVCSESEYALVVRGKGDRGTVAAYGSTDFFEAMREYNVLENEILARVSARLNQGFMNEQIPIRIRRPDWYGPGRAAQLWLDMLHDRISDKSTVGDNQRAGVRFRKSPDRKNEGGILSADVYQSLPSWFVDSARASYYGGWFEQFAHGHCGNVWEYDINSAYPFIIASLPCLHTAGSHNGAYSRGTGASYPHGDGHGVGESRTSRRVHYTLVHATVGGTDPYIGCLPFRTRTGNILRPHRLRGWYWLAEVEAARNAGLVDFYDVHEWVSYRACDCPSPFNPADIGIERMYRLRLELGKNSPAGKAFKLVYNSAYGKTAQSIGSPKYANPVYASLITSGCRTLILEAIASHPRKAAAVTMVATDGIYFLDEHPSLPLSPDKLGWWDSKVKRNMTQLMPGVYWDDETRERVRDGGTPKMKSRGVNAKDLASQIERLDYLFADAHFALTSGREYVWPEIEFAQRFLLTTAKAALHRGKWDDAGKVSHGSLRSISSNPQSKRQPAPYRDDHSGGIVRSRPYPEWSELDTVPYSKTFGQHDDEESDYIDRDGRDPLAYFRELLHV